MAQLRWVNHNQTTRQEIDGQHLWSPKTGSNGARSEFYNTMRRATLGDLVLLHADRAIGCIGRIAQFAFTAPKPMEFAAPGAYWNQEAMAGTAFSLEALSGSGSNGLTLEAVKELLDGTIERRIADDDQLEGTIRRSSSLDPPG